MENTLPIYLQNEYVIQEGEHLSCLGDLVSWYWCSIPILKENVQASGQSWTRFLQAVNDCKNMLEMKQLVNQFI